MRRWWFTVHKWVALVAGLQVLAWVVSGLFMTIFPIERVRSEHNIRTAPAVDLRTSPPLISTEQALAAAGAPVSRLELADVAGRPVWRAESEGKPFALIDAQSGDVISPLSETAAREIAALDFSGNGKIISARLIEKNPPIEYRSALPVWQIAFDDKGATHLYVSALTGKVAARRSGLWRAYDFLWSLHIMDWKGRDDFNNLPVVLFSFLAMVLTIGGIGILVIRFWPRRGKRADGAPRRDEAGAIGSEPRKVPAAGEAADDPLATFTEWASAADEKGYRKL